VAGSCQYADKYRQAILGEGENVDNSTSEPERWDWAPEGLSVRRGVPEFLPEPEKYHRKADVAIELERETWAQLYLNQTDLPSRPE
jgi:hypothetical protein